MDIGIAEDEVMILQRHKMLIRRNLIRMMWTKTNIVS